MRELHSINARFTARRMALDCIKLVSSAE